MRYENARIIALKLIKFFQDSFYHSNFSDTLAIARREFPNCLVNMTELRHGLDYCHLHNFKIKIVPGIKDEDIRITYGFSDEECVHINFTLKIYDHEMALKKTPIYTDLSITGCDEEEVSTKEIAKKQIMESIDANIESWSATLSEEEIAETMINVITTLVKQWTLPDDRAEIFKEYKPEREYLKFPTLIDPLPGTTIDMKEMMRDTYSKIFTLTK